MATMLDCGPTARELLTRLASPMRNRFYYGKLLDVYHLDLEQQYGIQKRWMLNRLALGTGVLCGLDVVSSADRKQVRVTAGVAIDGWGREIVVPSNSPGVDPTQPTDDCGNAAGDPVTQGPVTLCVCYHECEAEPTPALVADCPDRDCENGIVRERYRLRISAGSAGPPSSSVDCGTAFAALSQGETRRRHFCSTIDETCDAPPESCVPLALIEVADGQVKRIDGCIVRPVVYSNATLLDLILCLADRVDQCCGTVVAGEAIEKLSGDNQTGIAGQLAAGPLSVRVTRGGAPVANETVTFTAAAGSGTIGATPTTLGATYVATTDGFGITALHSWQFGPGAGTQSVTAAIASGSPASVTFNASVHHVATFIPVVNAIWPTNGSTVNANSIDPNQSGWFKSPRVELTFSNKMDPAMLATPANWLRMFAVRSIANQETEVQPLALKYAGPVGTPVLPQAGSCEGFSLPRGNVASLVNARLLVLIRAKGGNIDDTSSPPRLLDADFQGTMLATLPPPITHAGPKPWDAIWGAGGTLTFGIEVWDAIVATGAILPRSGDGTQGGDFDSFFAPIRQ